MKAYKDIIKNMKHSEWVRDGLALTFVFSWILLYPMHGFFLQAVFGPNAYVLGHIFSVSHGLGLIAFAFLSPQAAGNKKTIKLSGAVMFAVTFIWTYTPSAYYTQYIFAGLLGLVSAYLVLAWVPIFIRQKKPVLTVGLAMAATNILLGLTGFAQNLPELFLKTTAALSGLAPLLGALYISRKSDPVETISQVEKDDSQRIGATTILCIAAFAAAAYFSGGLWYRAVTPVFYTMWPHLIGVDTLIYALAVLALTFYAEKNSHNWVGTIALSLLGLGLATMIMEPYQPTVVAASLILLSAGLGATDLFYWLTLRRLAAFLGYQKTFGLGLGLSLFFITAPGVALDAQILSNPLTSPVAPTIGACLLFLINPLLVWSLRPLSLPGPDNTSSLNAYESSQVNLSEEPDSKNPDFWSKLTTSEKKIYDLICKGQTDLEISQTLYISRHTVKFHTRNILRKAGVSNRKELLALVFQNK